MTRLNQVRHWIGGQIRGHGALVLLLATFVALGLVYSNATPIFEAPNEPWRYLRIESIVGERPSPALAELRAARRSDNAVWEPPLYDYLAALLVREIDISQDQRAYTLNPWATLGDPTATGNRNAIVHLEPDDPPYVGVSAAVHRLRATGVLFSMLALWVIYMTVRLLAPTRRDLAIGAAALAGFTPGFIFVSAAVHSASLVALSASLCLYLAVRAQRRPQSLSTAAGLGLAAAAAMLTSRVGLVAPALILAVYGPRCLARRRAGEDGLCWRPLALALGAALLLGGWWWISQAKHWLAPAPATIEQMMRRAIASPQEYLSALLASYWATFGWINVPAEPWLHSFIAVLSIISLGGGLRFLLHLRWLGLSAQQAVRRTLPLMGVWIVLVGLSVVLHSRFRFWPQGIQFYPAIGAIAFFLYAGLSAWVRRHHNLLAAAVAALLFAVCLLAPGQFIAPAYAWPPRISLAALPQDMRALDLAFGDDLFLLGYTIEQDSVIVGQTTDIRLYWTTRKRILEDYTFTLFLLGRDEHIVGAVNSYPGRGNYVTRLWLPGEVVVDEYRIAVDPATSAPTGASVRVSIRPQPGAKAIDGIDRFGRNAGGAPQIASIRIAPPYRAIYQPTYRADVPFGERLALMGYSISPQNPAAGEEWQIDLVWRSLRRISQDYTVFVHLVDQNGEVIAQADGPPLAGEYPTSLWRVNEQVLDARTMRLPETAPSGQYWLRVGWYLRDTGERLMVDHSDPAISYAALGPFYFDIDRRPEIKDAIPETGL